MFIIVVIIAIDVIVGIVLSFDLSLEKDQVFLYLQSKIVSNYVITPGPQPHNQAVRPGVNKINIYLKAIAALVGPARGNKSTFLNPAALVHLLKSFNVKSKPSPVSINMFKLIVSPKTF